MENKYINRYKNFCRSLNNLKKSKTADPDADFVLEGTAQNYNLTFDLSWKVMKDILVKVLGINDIARGSPRANLQAAFSNKLIDDDVWLQMLRTRNLLAHDYDGAVARENFEKITTVYYDVFYKFKMIAEEYFEKGMQEEDSFKA